MGGSLSTMQGCWQRAHRGASRGHTVVLAEGTQGCGNGHAEVLAEGPQSELHSICTMTFSRKKGLLFLCSEVLTLVVSSQKDSLFCSQKGSLWLLWAKSPSRESLQ